MSEYMEKAGSLRRLARVPAFYAGYAMTGRQLTEAVRCRPYSVVPSVRICREDAT